MNGQTPPRRKRPTKPDPHPTETPRPARPRRTKAAASSPATTAASTPVRPVAGEAGPTTPPAAMREPTPAPIPVFAPAPLPDRIGDVSPALTPRQMAFMALVAAVILAVIRRLLGRRESRR